jgi:hypothetical protein
MSKIHVEQRHIVRSLDFINFIAAGPVFAAVCDQYSSQQFGIQIILPTPIFPCAMLTSTICVDALCRSKDCVAQ